jgi:hypothetical protein
VTSEIGHFSDVEAMTTKVRLLGAKRPCRLSFGQASELLGPFDRELLQEIVELKDGRLSAFENGFDDLGRQQGKAQHPAEVGFVDGLVIGMRTVMVRPSWLRVGRPN